MRQQIKEGNMKNLCLDHIRIRMIKSSSENIFFMQLIKVQE